MKLNELKKVVEGMTKSPWVVKYRKAPYQADQWVESEHGDLGEPADGGGLGTFRADDSEGIAALRNHAEDFIELAESCRDLIDEMDIMVKASQKIAAINEVLIDDSWPHMRVKKALEKLEGLGE